MRCYVLTIIFAAAAAVWGPRAAFPSPGTEPVTFLASNPTTHGSPGHIWVAFPDRGIALGFYSDGILDDSRRRADAAVTFFLGPEDVAAALEVVDSYQDRRYNLITNNCRNFVRDVALALGLNVPSLRQIDLRSPGEFLEDLVESNATLRAY